MNTGVPHARHFFASLLASLVENPKSHNFFSMLAIVYYEETAIHQNVCWFQVTVDDELFVKVVKTQRHLIADQSQHTLWELPTEQLGSLTILAILHKDVVVFAVFDVAVKLDYVWMIQF